MSLHADLIFKGLKAMMISSAPGTADTPRAHLLNPMAMECLRELGLEDDAVRMGVTGPPLEYMRWCYSMVGEEYGKIYAWGGAPSTKADVVSSTPSRFLDCPQSYLEPILLRYASTNGITCRFDTELVSFEHDGKGIVSTVKDRISQNTYQIRSRYLFGADGGRSVVGRSGGFEFLVEPSGGVACNVHFTADLDRRMSDRDAQLHVIMKPDARTRFGIAPIIRMIRPYTDWMLVAFSPGLKEDPFRHLTPTSPELLEYLKEAIGDESIEIKVKRLEPWNIRETVADKYSKPGNVYLLGDAAHRHPPAYGLGSNTSMQDAYNLGWKVLYVSKGLAGPALLESYSTERQPVGARLVRESNECMDRHAAVWAALGMFAETPEDGARQIAELSQSTEAGTVRREQLYQALEGKRREGESFGFNMNQWYTSSAVYLDDEEPRAEFAKDYILDIYISTYPGNRLPHAWLTAKVPSKPVSTIDIAGKGAFCIFTGHGGDAWKEAAAEISKSTGIPIKSYSIGWGLDYNDKYREWIKRREVGEDGCVLVRPDRYVAWRSKKMIPDCKAKLQHVLDHVLSRDQLTHANGSANGSV
ncbi:phenol 2-monooxygenase [Rhizodiscina lignyota]|uniref:Phenol 2-monooxygenase n=1 Tax=Rhizodiscina lignyota TaxID=1504668 RepID=A0A9P4M2K9_9PEZI|nr:phenol 2-monooxygenase [Rhizodiscina lignyota]